MKNGYMLIVSLGSVFLALTFSIKTISAQENVEVLEGHTAQVTSVAFNRNGNLLASTSADRTIRLWTVSTGKELTTLRGHTDVVNSVAFRHHTIIGPVFPNPIIASGSDDQTVRLWIVNADGDWQHWKTLRGHTGWVTSVAFSPDGSTLASGSNDGTIRLWTTNSWTTRKILRGHSGAVTSVAFSGDSSTLASASTDETIRLWTVNPGGHRKTIIGHANFVWSVSFSGDGRLLASGSFDNLIRLWEADTGEHLKPLVGHTDLVLDVAFSGNGGLLASCGKDRTVRLWDGVTGEHRDTLTGHTDIVYSVALNNNGSLLASGSFDRTVRLWKLTPFTRDDHGNTWADATPLPLDESLPGVIETGNDVDYFRVEVPSRGELTLYTTGNLDTFGQLERATGDKTRNNNSGSGLNFRIHHDVIPQTYYVRVTASSNMTGSYTIHASFTPKVEELPDLVVESLTANKIILDPGETFTLTATLKNQGIGRADAPIYYRWHRSTQPNIHKMMGSDRVYTRASEEKGEKETAVTLILEEKKYKDVALTTNQSSDQFIFLTAPEKSGTYYYSVCVLNEIDERNNCSADVRITVLPDLTGDGSIDENDFLIVVAQFGLNGAPATTGDTIEDITDATVKDIYRDYEVSGVISDISIAVKTHADLNTDGTVDFADIELIAKVLEDRGVFAAPNIARLIPDPVKQWMTETKQMWENDSAFFDGIAALEQFHTLLPPMATALLSNYPNPFNPETWIPYQLAKPADVRLTIYDTNGHPVRTLDIGHRLAGYYQDRARAAYWDGRNTHGEPVASGVYFYMLSAGDFTATRRMLIRK